MKNIFGILAILLINVSVGLGAPVPITHIVDRDWGAETYDKINTSFDFLYEAQLDAISNRTAITTLEAEVVHINENNSWLVTPHIDGIPIPNIPTAKDELVLKARAYSEYGDAILWLPLDDNANNVITGNAVQPLGPTNLTFTTGKFGTCLTDGTTSPPSWTDIGKDYHNPDWMDGSVSYTISFWMYNSSSSYSELKIWPDSSRYSPLWNCVLTGSGGVLFLGDSNSQPIGGFGALGYTVVDDWNFITLTYDHVDKANSVYVGTELIRSRIQTKVTTIPGMLGVQDYRVVFYGDAKIDDFAIVLGAATAPTLIPITSTPPQSMASGIYASGANNHDLVRISDPGTILANKRGATLSVKDAPVYEDGSRHLLVTAKGDYDDYHSIVGLDALPNGVTISTPPTSGATFLGMDYDAPPIVYMAKGEQGYAFANELYLGSTVKLGIDTFQAGFLSSDSSFTFETWVWHGPVVDTNASTEASFKIVVNHPSQGVSSLVTMTVDSLANGSVHFGYDMGLDDWTDWLLPDSYTIANVQYGWHHYSFQFTENYMDIPRVSMDGRYFDVNKHEQIEMDPALNMFTMDMSEAIIPGSTDRVQIHFNTAQSNAVAYVGLSAGAAKTLATFTPRTHRIGRTFTNDDVGGVTTSLMTLDDIALNRTPTATFKMNNTKTLAIEYDRLSRSISYNEGFGNLHLGTIEPIEGMGDLMFTDGRIRIIGIEDISLTCLEPIGCKQLVATDILMPSITDCKITMTGGTVISGVKLDTNLTVTNGIAVIENCIVNPFVTIDTTDGELVFKNCIFKQEAGIAVQIGANLTYDTCHFNLMPSLGTTRANISHCMFGTGGNITDCNVSSSIFGYAAVIHYGTVKDSIFGDTADIDDSTVSSSTFGDHADIDDSTVSSSTFGDHANISGSTVSSSIFGDTADVDAECTCNFTTFGLGPILEAGVTTNYCIVE